MKRHLPSVVVIAITLFVSLSCQRQATELEVTVSPTNNVNLIDGSTQSCIDVATTIAGTPPSYGIGRFYIRWRNIRLNWSGSNSLGLSYIRITLRDDNIQDGSYTCNIAGDELNYLFNVAAGALVPKKTILNGPASGGTACNLACGGIPLVDEKISTAASVTIQVIGYSVDSDGDTPVSATTTTSAVYIPPES